MVIRVLVRKSNIYIFFNDDNFLSGTLGDFTANAQRAFCRIPRTLEQTDIEVRRIPPNLLGS